VKKYYYIIKENIKNCELIPLKNIISLWKSSLYEKSGKQLILINTVFALVLIILTFFEYLPGKENGELFCLITEFVVALVSVIMTISTLTAGFAFSLAVNAARVGHCAFKVAFGRGAGRDVDGLNTVYELIFSITVVAIISLVYIFLFSINNRLKPLLKENSEYSKLAKEAKAANKRVEESSKIIDKNEKELYSLAFYDQLTSLANRVKIKEEIISLIESKTPFSVIFIGLDDFKAINESKSHEAGDKVLVEVSKRIALAADHNDICGRLGGDEFIIVSPTHATDEACKEYVEEIYRTFAACFHVDGGVGIYVNASFGTALYPKDGETCSKLLKNADIALNKAKNEGKNRYVLFDRNMQIEIDFQSQIATYMHSALENNEFYLVYQPQFFPNKKLRGFEALIRWNSPQLGSISPVSFIPVAENSNFITVLGQWILETACKKLAEITEIYGSNVIMSVNVSSKQFREKDFVKSVSKALLENGANSSQLELEVTETLLLNSVEDTASMLAQLKRMNIRTSIDDFGTGYSSLSYLRMLPIDTLKIDKSFVDVIIDDASGKSIVDTIIKLAHTLGMTVIAEGVEYSEQLEYLKSRSCDCIQGFLFSKPLEDEDVNSLVMEYGGVNTV